MAVDTGIMKGDVNCASARELTWFYLKDMEKQKAKHVTPWNRFLLEKQIVTLSASQEISRLLWNSEGALSCSQDAATGQYPASDASSPQLPTQFP